MGFLKFMQGKKTYTTVIGAGLFTLGSVLLGDMGWGEAVNWLFAYFGLGGLRAGVSRDG